MTRRAQMTTLPGISPVPLVPRGERANTPAMGLGVVRGCFPLVVVLAGCPEPVAPPSTTVPSQSAASPSATVPAQLESYDMPAVVVRASASPSSQGIAVFRMAERPRPSAVIARPDGLVAASTPFELVVRRVSGRRWFAPFGCGQLVASRDGAIWCFEVNRRDSQQLALAYSTDEGETWHVAAQDSSMVVGATASAWPSGGFLVRDQRGRRYLRVDRSASGVVARRVGPQFPPNAGLHRLGFFSPQRICVDGPADRSPCAADETPAACESIPLLCTEDLGSERATWIPSTPIPMWLPVSTDDGRWCAVGSPKVPRLETILCATGANPTTFVAADAGKYTKFVAMTGDAKRVFAAGEAGGTVDVLTVQNDAHLQYLQRAPDDASFGFGAFNGSGGALAVAGLGLVYVLDEPTGVFRGVSLSEN